MECKGSGGGGSGEVVGVGLGWGGRDLANGKCWLRHTVHSFVFCFIFLVDYKQKYGEEHGSCQAGIAGVFTEVSNYAHSLVHTQLFAG